MPGPVSRDALVDALFGRYQDEELLASEHGVWIEGLDGDKVVGLDV